jgi:AcrR family transcriptional regulator
MCTTMDTKKRSYEMTARKEATAATRDAILDAAIDSVVAERSLAITLGAVAERAGVTVKTVLRHFGSREALVDAAWLRLRQEVLAERTAPPGDPETAVAVLIEHYERRGNTMLGVLAEEDDDPRARLMCDDGRLGHRGWVEQVFGAHLPVESVERSRLVDVLVVATDVYSWKLLRRDRDLSVDDVRDRMLFVADAVLAMSRTHRTRE